MAYYVYFLTNHTNKTLYTGFTGNLQERIMQHKSYQIEGFTKKYKTSKLVYVEEYANVEDAKVREKAIKKWNRAWKDALVNQSNPNWEDLLI